MGRDSLKEDTARGISGLTLFFSSVFLSPVLPSLRRARALIKKHEKDLHKLAKGLLDHETLTGDQIRTMFNLQQEGVKKRKEPRGVMGAQ